MPKNSINSDAGELKIRSNLKGAIDVIKVLVNAMHSGRYADLRAIDQNALHLPKPR